MYELLTLTKREDKLTLLHSLVKEIQPYEFLGSKNKEEVLVYWESVKQVC